MIRPIDIRLNAAHPDYPLAEAVTFTGSPSTVLIRGVPPNCGRWAITAVSVAATYPDGSTTTRAAVQSANGVWVATLPATATSGRTANGLRVLADGIDETGEAVTGYVLGVAAFAVASLGVAPAPEPGETSWQMLYFDAVPGTLRKGDVTKMDGVLKFYNGTAWEPFAAPVNFDNAVTKDSANGVKSSGIWSALWGALTALPTGFTSLYDWCVSQLAGKASTADATLVNASDWVCSPAEVGGGPVYIIQNLSGAWYPADGEGGIGAVKGDAQSLSLSWAADEWYGGVALTATRVALGGYVLGSQTDKPLASEAEAEALRDGKLDKNGGTMTGTLTIAGVDGDNTEIIKAFLGSASSQKFVIGVNGGNFYIGQYGHNLWLPYTSGTLALTADIPYNLVTKTIDNGAVTLDDRAINIVTLDASVTSATFTFPAHTDGKARDFFIRLVIQGTTVPTLYFNEPDGGGAVAFDVDDDSWADIEPGVNLLMFTDTAE